MKIIFLGLILLLNGKFVAGAPPADRSNSTSMTNELPTSDGDTSMEGPATGEDLSPETEPPTMEPTEQSTPDVEVSTMDTEAESASTSEYAMEPSQTSEDPRDSSLASEASESPQSSDTFTESSQPPMQSSSPSEASTASKENTEATETSPTPEVPIEATESPSSSEAPSSEELRETTESPSATEAFSASEKLTETTESPSSSEASPPSEVPTETQFPPASEAPTSEEAKETTESFLSSEAPSSEEPTEATESSSASETPSSEVLTETTLETTMESESPSSENPTETTDYSSASEAPASEEPIETTPAETTMESESTSVTETASSETPEPETSSSEMPTIGPIEQPPVSTEGEETMEMTTTAVVVETSTTVNIPSTMDTLKMLAPQFSQYCKYVFTPVDVAPTEDTNLRYNKSHEVASLDAMATRREVLLKYKLLDKNSRADVGDGETEIGPGSTVKHQPKPDAVEIMMKKYREKAANGGEVEAKLLKIKGVEKYFARDVRGNRNKYCLFSIVYQLRDAQGPVVKMMPVGISMNPEVADLVKKGQEYDLLVPQQKTLYDVLFVSIARKEVELANENPPHPSSMIHYATVMGADGQSVLITMHPTEPSMPEAGTDEKA